MLVFWVLTQNSKPITQNRFPVYDIAVLIDLQFFYGQATKGVRWMPRQRKAMKDVVSCDKPRGAAKRALIRGFPNGETHWR